METDLVLLRRYADRRDAEAFRELVRRHAGMVYAASRRVTGSSMLAEDVAQECFMTLAREAGGIRSSLPGWLHRTATHRALNAVRGESRRRQREEQASPPAAVSSVRDNPTWEEVGPYVDEALSALPDHLREPLVLYFLEQRNKESIARELAVDGSTVSRRIDKGIGLIRGRLKKAGFAVPAAILATFLAEKTCVAAPAALNAILGKMAIAGLGGSALAGSAGTAATGTGAATAAAATTGGVVMGTGIKVAISAVVVSAIVTGVVVASRSLTQEKSVQPVETASVPVVSLPEPQPVVAASLFDRDAVIADLMTKFNVNQPPNEFRERLAALDDDSLRALLAFHDAYRLPPGEVLKLVPQPFSSGRKVFWEVINTVGEDRAGPRVFVFEWNEGTLWSRGRGFGRITLLNELQSVTGRIGRQYIDGDLGLVSTLFPGDLVLRKDSTPEQKVVALEKSLRDAGWPIRLEFREVEREAIIIEGTYSSKPLPDYKPDQVVIYGSTPRKDPRSGGGGGGNLERFCDWLGTCLGRPVFAGNVTGVPRMFSWLLGPIPSSTRDAPSTPLPDDETNLVLQHITDQTGLTFKRELRPVRLLFVDNVPLTDEEIREFQETVPSVPANAAP